LFYRRHTSEHWQRLHMSAKIADTSFKIVLPLAAGIVEDGPRRQAVERQVMRVHKRSAGVVGEI